MEIGYTIWTWGLQTEENLTTALKELRELGYTNIENFIGIANMYEGRTEEFNKLFADYGMRFIAIYNYIVDLKDNNVEKAIKYLDFCQKTGAKIMNIQAPPRKSYRPSCDDLLELSAVLNEIGKAAMGYGVKLCMHPHYETTVETVDEIDFIANHTSPEYVSFCFDTAHTILGHMDPVEAIQRYGQRIGFMHLKDEPFNTKPETYRKNWIQGKEGWQRFYELGTQDVNFVEVVDALKKIGYDGYLVVELDTPAISNYEGAKANKNYLASIGL